MIGRTNACGLSDPSIPVGTGQHLVTFYDYNGKVLKRQRVATGGDATAPTTPTHEFLTFAEWNNPFTNVQNDIDVGAIYNTTDGKTYLFITLTTLTGLAPTLYFNKSTTSLMTINWGDGTTSTSTTSGNQNITHTYSTAGDYIITVDNSAGGTFGFGNGSSTTSIFGNTTSNPYLFILTKVYLSLYSISTMPFYCFNSQKSLKYISFGSPYRLLQGAFEFQNSSALKYITVNLGNMGNSSFSGCQSLLNISFQKMLFTNGGCFNGCIGLTKIIIPNAITALYLNLFANCGSITEYIFESTTPPSFGTTVFLNINPICKIYVPDASVEAYKAATNIAGIYDSYIYPLSEKPQSNE